MMAGAVCACRLPGADGNRSLLSCLLVLAAGVLAYAALVREKLLPASFTVSPSGMLAAVVALLLFSSSSILRLDLFSPLSMKVMKGVHDFVHQFMESILIPDHLFIRPVVWKYIGLLFGKEVGFWGGMVIWFTPAVLIALAIRFERLPSVAHIRQGAQRRKLLAAAIRARRYRLVMPAARRGDLCGRGLSEPFPERGILGPETAAGHGKPGRGDCHPEKGRGRSGGRQTA